MKRIETNEGYKLNQESEYAKTVGIIEALFEGIPVRNPSRDRKVAITGDFGKCLLPGDSAALWLNTEYGRFVIVKTNDTLSFALTSTEDTMLTKTGAEYFKIDEEDWRYLGFCSLTFEGNRPARMFGDLKTVFNYLNSGRWGEIDFSSNKPQLMFSGGVVRCFSF